MGSVPGKQDRNFSMTESLGFACFSRCLTPFFWGTEGRTSSKRGQDEPFVRWHGLTYLVLVACM